MACNVCGEETGWAENPLVYCDGNDGHCSVAVHQACYGITTVPSGAWLCGKCTSSERKAKVRCELCPNKDGAFKKTSAGNFAHVVCSLYIPEVRFGNVCTMEPIILSSIPSDRFQRNCYICEDRGRESKSKVGACMQCEKSGCKQYFHVTCAQAQGLLCEQAGNSDDNVKYCGYCKYHYQRMKKDHNIKFIPAFKPEPTRSEKSDSSPEKKSHHHTNSDTSKPPKKKQKFYGTSNLADSDIEMEKEPKPKRKRTSSSNKDSSSLSVHNKHSSSKETSNLFGKDSSDHSSSESIITPVNKRSRESSSKSIFDSDTDDDVQYKRSKTTDSSEKKKSKKVSSKSKEKEKDKEKDKEKEKDNEKLSEKPSSSKESSNKKMKKKKDEATFSSSKTPSKSPIHKEEISSKSFSKADAEKKSNSSEEKQSKSTSSHHENNLIVEKVNSAVKSPVLHVEKETIEEDDLHPLQSTLIQRNELPKQDFDLPEIIRHSSFFEEEGSKSQKPILTFEELLERQWNQSAQFVMEQTFDISSLISVLYKLKSENRSLDDKLRALTQKRDHLISVNSRLAIPLNTPTNGIENWESSNNNPLASTTSNNALNKSNEAAAAAAVTATNLFFNQNALAQQQNFSSLHNASTPSPTTNQSQQQKQNSSNTSSNHSNFFASSLNHVNNINSSLNNQSFKSSLDMNSNINTSFFDSSSLKQSTANNNFHYTNGLFHQAVNGQFTSTSSPSKLNASSFNNSIANSTNNSNLMSPQIFQNFLQSQQAFSQLNQQTQMQNSVLNGSQTKR